MNIKDDTLTIMSKKHENLIASVSEYLSDDELKVMEEVEFTVVTVSQRNSSTHGFVCLLQLCFFDILNLIFMPYLGKRQIEGHQIEEAS